MAQKYIDTDTLNFILYDVHDLESVMKNERHADHDRESVDMFLTAVKDFSDKELFPYVKEMDEQPAYFKDGKIITHPQIGNIIRQVGDLGWIAGLMDYEDGGIQLPYTAYTAAGYIMEAANNHAIGYLSLTFGSAELIMEFGDENLKKNYASKMLAGKWCGTMCLTEPQAGSSLSDITTTAYSDGKGGYKLKGQKIFISGGDHEHTENIVHLVLARIEGAPKGTKGISLFVVPKKRYDESGELISNDVITAGDFQKMGQRGYCTTHLIFGENDDCEGLLIGEANRGLKYMFMMMNGARIAVGRGAGAIAMASYHASLEYARERPQGRRIGNGDKKNKSAEQTLIINHPDVRRMLLFQKAVAEGALCLTMLSAKYYDLHKTATDETEKEKYNLLLELLMPISKTYPSEAGIDSCNASVQVLGGYGFCTEYIPQMYLRDIRISSIYEGTTGIQSLDLLGRKVPMQGGKAVQLLAVEIMETIQEAMTFDDLQPYATALGEKLQVTQKVLGHLGGFAAKGNFEQYLSDATIFLKMFANIVIGWLWLQMMAKSKQALVSGKKSYSDDFYESKIHTGRFFFKYELPKVDSLATTLMSPDILTIAEEKNVFI